LLYFLTWLVAADAVVAAAAVEDDVNEEAVALNDPWVPLDGVLVDEADVVDDDPDPFVGDLDCAFDLVNVVVEGDLEDVAVDLVDDLESVVGDAVAVDLETFADELEIVAAVLETAVADLDLQTAWGSHVDVEVGKDACRV
jgi:hypothetical protein